MVKYYKQIALHHMFDLPTLSHAKRAMQDLPTNSTLREQVGVVDIRSYTLHYSRTLKFDPMSLR